MNSIDARIVKRLPAIKDTAPFQLNVHLRAEDGISVIIGPSGSGKTMLLDCMCGFVRPDEGRILVHDELYFDAATHVHLRPELRRCGYIFQDHALFPHMTVRENLQFAASIVAARGGRLQVRRRVNELLETFDLTTLDARKPAHLSGGQKQRAALARILLTEPRLLLLDEPSRGLDSYLRQTLYALLRSVRESLSIPILLVSHHVEECLELADSVAILDAGRLLQHGKRAEMLAKPATVDVARLLGVFNIAHAEIKYLDPTADLSRLHVLGQEVEGPYFPGHLIGDTGYLCMRRSEWKLLPDNIQPSPRHLTLRFERAQISHYGVRIELENGFSVIVREAEYEAIRHKEKLTFEVPASAMAFTGT